MRKFIRGDFVIYDQITPGRGGTDTGTEGRNSDYCVQHYLTVRESGKKGTVVLETQSGEMHVILNTNPNLRRARWWERVLYRDRFPRLNLSNRGE